MNAEGLDAQQVLAVGDALGDVVGVRLCGWSAGGGADEIQMSQTLHRPAGLPPREGWPKILDLEPVSRAVVVVGRAWRLGHVPGVDVSVTLFLRRSSRFPLDIQRDGPLVVHGLIGDKGEGIPCGNGNRHCVCP